MSTTAAAAVGRQIELLELERDAEEKEHALWCQSLSARQCEKRGISLLNLALSNTAGGLHTGRSGPASASSCTNAGTATGAPHRRQMSTTRLRATSSALSVPAQRAARLLRLIERPQQLG